MYPTTMAIAAISRALAGLALLVASWVACVLYAAVRRITRRRKPKRHGRVCRILGAPWCG
jgi:hypothetical protein